MCNDPMHELSNPGASGSIFYITEDDEFIVKTVQHSEADFLQKLLPGYYMVSTHTHVRVKSRHGVTGTKTVIFMLCDISTSVHVHNVHTSTCAQCVHVMHMNTQSIQHE